MLNSKLNHMRIYFLGDDIKISMKGWWGRGGFKGLQMFLILEFTCHYWSWNENEKTCLLVQVIVSSRMFVRHFTQKNLDHKRFFLIIT